MKTYRLSQITSALVLALGLSTSALANTTTSAIKGNISGPNGNAAVGTQITIIHVPSGTTKTATVNASGLFTAKGLRVGGPYKIIVDSDRFQDTELNNVFLTLGQTFPITVALESKDHTEVIEVTGSRISKFAAGSSPGAHFNAEDLANLPAINRDLKDIVRVDPRIYIDESRDDAIQCGGGSPRFNSLTLDGARMNDNFGLNGNGYPTVRVPFSYDSIDQVSVELAPFDVKYGSFSACNINAVTKSGGNEVHGGVFFDYTNDSMQGDTIDGEPAPSGDFSEKRYGFNVGFPILKDKLFAFVAYEKLDGAEIFEYPGFVAQPAGDDIGNVVSQADIDRITQIAADKYKYDVGSMPGSMPVEDEKLLIKLDWNINDDHRASLVYNYNDGFKLSQSDDWAVTLDSHFYERGAKLQSFVGALHSDWSDNFSTSITVGKMDLDNRANSLDAASSFGEVQIRHNGKTIFLGPDDSRQSNEMYWDNMTFKFGANYYLDDHTLTFGYEYESLTAFNLFMQHTDGEYRFDSIDDFEAGDIYKAYYNNSAGTNIPEDASQEFTYDVHTFYLQDEYTFTDIDASLTFGFRYDMYTSSDKPRYNAQFEERYGFANNHTFDGVSLFQPRVGFQWTVDDNLSVRAGFGLYSGGNPNVWLSNSYSNDGLVQIATSQKGVNLFDEDLTGDGRPGYDNLQSLYDKVGGYAPEGGDGKVNAVDPDFEMPSEWKYSIGATYMTDNGYNFTADLLLNKKVNSATIKDVGIQYSEKTAPDGRPMYEEKDGRSGEYLLTNSGKDGQSTVFSIGMNKSFDFGLDVTFGYAFTASEDANAMTSSVAGSNYGNVAATDAINPGMATSDYEIPHRFTLVLNYNIELIENLNTRVSLFGQASTGRPYSYTFDSSDSVANWPNYEEESFGDSNWNGSRQLLYVPAENDPNVIYAEGFDTEAFNSFIANEGLTRGKIQERNEHNADWWTTFDVKLTQEIPGFSADHKGSVFLVIKNIGNMMNDSWGVMNKGGFVGNRMVEATINDSGQYVYHEFNQGNEKQEVQNRASLWQVRVGVNYKF
ncbi:TonB-dependent receptor [Colwellia piezophila]|uniref:TonB-dependent receptor n=1 Tax=Colwellia piezophila TaxID=211668 RepID=UPI00037245BB|nr:TonB-dependent receptor [Colwellia piezophila]